MQEKKEYPPNIEESFIKNRLSIDDVTIGLAFLGKSGRFEELPPAKKMTIEDYKKYYEMTNS